MFAMPHTVARTLMVTMLITSVTAERYNTGLLLSLQRDSIQALQIDVGAKEGSISFMVMN